MSLLFIYIKLENRSVWLSQKHLRSNLSVMEAFTGLLYIIWRVTRCTRPSICLKQQGCTGIYDNIIVVQALLFHLEVYKVDLQYAWNCSYIMLSIWLPHTFWYDKADVFEHNELIKNVCNQDV